MLPENRADPGLEDCTRPPLWFALTMTRMLRYLTDTCKARGKGVVIVRMDKSSSGTKTTNSILMPLLCLQGKMDSHSQMQN